MTVNTQDRIFKWQIAIFDDNPDQYDKNAIENDFDVLWVDALSKIPDNIVSIRNSHLAIIDMTWFHEACEVIDACQEKRLFVPTPDQMRSMCPADIASQWVRAISAWTLHFDEDASHPKRFPTTSIQEKEIGLWIGALLSWSSPNTIPIFLTGYKEHFKRGNLGPLSLFSKAPFVVNYKSTSATESTETIEGNEFRRALSSKQFELFKNPEARMWFFSQVLINLLDGKECEEGSCRLYYDGFEAVESVRMTFENVFPYLKKMNRQRLVPSVRQYFRMPELSTSEYIAMRAVRHTLSRNENSSTSDLEEAHQHALSAGGFYENLPQLITEMISIKKNPQYDPDEIKNRKEKVVILLDAVFVDSEKALRDFHADNRKWIVNLDGKGPRAITNQADTSIRDTRESGLRFHRFPVKWLNDIFYPLYDNCERPTISCDWEGQAFEFLKDEKSFFIFKFSSQWKGALDRGVFWQAVRESNKSKGELRGLPLVIRRALETGADAFFLKTGKDCDFVWNELSLNVCKDDIHNERWDFQLALVFLVTTHG